MIYISAYPKSGSTFLTNLLGDILGSSTAGCMVGAADIVTKKRPGPYLIRRGHFILIDSDTGPVVPQPHQLAYKRLTTEKIIFLVRDPRDICVSGAWHWQVSVEDFLEQMLRGDVAGCGRWDEYCDRWLSRFYPNSLGIVKYEGLIEDAFVEVGQILLYINKSFTRDDNNKKVLRDAIDRQSFAIRKAKIGDNQDELRRHNMRLGVAGDWRNHFTPEMNERIWSEFGWMAERLGYKID